MFDRDSRKQLMTLVGEFGTIGMTVAFCIFIGVWIGHFLDHRVFHDRTTPGFTLFFLVIGIIAGFKNLWDFVRHNIEKSDKK